MELDGGHGVHAGTTAYDLCLAWSWEYDADFVALLDTACRARGLTLLQVTPRNLTQIVDDLTRRQVAFRILLDRASDVDARFFPLVDWACAHATRRINPLEWAVRAWDKAAMHLVFIASGLHAPYTIILPSYEEQPELPPMDLAPLGDTFSIKPAHGSGGVGVINAATSLAQIWSARREFPLDRYLVQAHVVAVSLDSRLAWFRVIYCDGDVYPCWWNACTHRYELVAAVEEAEYCLAPLRDIAIAIARLCKLDLFSTEVALTPDGRFVIVDYVNDPLDLRLQSRTEDGVPDAVVRGIAERLASAAQRTA